MGGRAGGWYSQVRRSKKVSDGCTLRKRRFFKLFKHSALQAHLPEDTTFLLNQFGRRIELGDRSIIHDDLWRWSETMIEHDGGGSAHQAIVVDDGGDSVGDSDQARVLEFFADRLL